MQHLSQEILTRQNGSYIIDQLLINFSKAGTRDYLIQNLKKMKEIDLQLWLPQLCYFFVRNNIEKLGVFLKDLALTNLQNYYLIEWLLKSLDDQSGNETHILQFRRKLEIEFVNNGTNQYISEKAQSDETLNKMILDKEYRSSYIVGSDHLISSLIQFSLTLKSVAYLERKEKTTAFLKDINLMIKRMQYTLHAGVTIPFCSYSNSSLMVNIFENEFTCYNTANRVPYRIIIETVDPIEFQLFQSAIYQSERQFDMSGSNFEIRNDLEDQMRKIAYSKMFDYQNIDDLKKLAIDHLKRQKNKLIKKPIQDVFASKYETSSVWGQSWEKSALQFKKESQFRLLKSYQLRQIIIKGGDDLRQELLVMQILNKIKDIWEKEKQPLYLKPYEIIITSPNSGIIEFIPNTISIDSLKGKYPNLKLRELFEQEFGNNFFEAQQNFANSLAAYSIVCYLIQLKDRHNGNILIDIEGNIIHIDFGFILTLTPGNLGFESAPFKMVDEYIELLDGINSPMMSYFETMIFKGLLSLQKHVDEILLFIKAFTIGDKKTLLYCLQNLNLKDLRKRFCENMSVEELIVFAQQLVKSSINSWSTSIYDYFQYKSNGINY